MNVFLHLGHGNRAFFRSFETVVPDVPVDELEDPPGLGRVRFARRVFNGIEAVFFVGCFCRMCLDCLEVSNNCLE